jgi:GTP-binding protein HflX
VEEVRQRRETAARARERRLLPTMAIVGYTNAGKSTLLNALVGEEAAMVEDMLFATLDPTTRRVRLGEGQTVIVSDTVGFIHKLPHQLVEAFQATLEEVTRSDVLLEVVDLSDPHAPEHRRTVQTVLDELGAGHKPRVVVLNKADLVTEDGAVNGNWGTGAVPARVVPGGILGRDDHYAVRVSALSGKGIDALRQAMATVLAELWVELDLALPYSAGELLARVRERGTVEFEYKDEDVHIQGRVPPSLVEDIRRAAAAWALAQEGREGGG